MSDVEEVKPQAAKLSRLSGLAAAGVKHLRAYVMTQLSREPRQ